MTFYGLLIWMISAIVLTLLYLLLFLSYSLVASVLVGAFYLTNFLVLLSGWLLYVFGKIKCLSCLPHREGASLLKASLAMDTVLVFIVFGVGMLTDGQPPKPDGVREFALYILFIVYVNINDFLSKEWSALILLTKVLSAAFLLCFLIRVSQNLNSPHLANTGNRALRFTAGALFCAFW